MCWTFWQNKALWLGIFTALLVGCSPPPTSTPQSAIEISATPRPTLTPTISPPTPDVTPEPTTCVINPAWEDTYTVQAGDTLGGIAFLLGLSLAEIQAGNCLGQSDFLFIGQILNVPNGFALGLATDPEAATASILFVRDEGEFVNLWGVRANGVAPQRLTTNMLINAPPVRSTDLTQVALRGVSPSHAPRDPRGVELNTLPSDIWLISTDGQGLRQLVNQGPADNVYRSQPAWSPDGTRIAFTEQRGAAGSLVIIEPNGRNRQVVMTSDFTPFNQQVPTTPAWSPNGRQVAVVAWDNTQTAHIYLVDANANVEPESVYSGFTYYGQGPYWVPFNGLNGRPAIAVLTLDQQLDPLWQVVDVVGRTVENRSGGLRLVNATVAWLVEPQRNNIAITDVNGLTLQTADSDLQSVSFAPDRDQLVIGFGEDGLDYFRIGETLRQTIVGGSVLYPVWSPPQYVVLP